jgi:hypothetical protein
MKPANFLFTIIALCISASVATGQVVLSEIMFHAPQLESYEEFIELYNPSATASVNLSGWRLGDQLEQDSLVDAGHGLILPPLSFALVLDPGYWGNSTIYDPVMNQDALIVTISDGSFGANGLRNDPPDTVVLLNASGAVVASFCYPSCDSGGYSSEKIRLDWGDDQSNWATCLSWLGTPGSLNSVQPPNLDLGFASLQADPSPIPVGSNVTLTAVLVNLGMEVITSGQVGFGLSNLSATVPYTMLGEGVFETLLPADSTLVSLSLSTVPPGPHRFWAWHGFPDFRPENDTISLIVIGGYEPGTVIINEFMAHPMGNAPEWVEIYNPGPDGVELMGFTLADEDTAERMAITDSSLVLEAGEYALVSEDSSLIDSSMANVKVFVLGNSWPYLNDGGDAIYLFDSAGIQEVVPYYGWPISSGISLERLYSSHSSIDPTNWQLSSHPSGSTPGQPNSFQPIPPVTSSGSLSFSPDPFDPDTHGAMQLLLDAPTGTSSAAIFIFDLRGRRLKVIFDDYVTLGAREFLWDGRDRDGRRLPPGLFLVFAEFRDSSGKRNAVVKKTLVIAGKL